MYKSYMYIFIFVRNCGGWLSSHKTVSTSNAIMQSSQMGKKGRLYVAWTPMSKIRNTNKGELKYMPIYVASDPVRYPAEAGNLCHGADRTYPSGPRVIETEKRYRNNCRTSCCFPPTSASVEQQQWVSVEVLECRNILQFSLLFAFWSLCISYRGL